VRIASALLLLALAACDGSIRSLTDVPPTGPVDPPEAGPAKCEPSGAPVARLLRLSNHEYQ
jgi:hypothetical protein